LLLALLCDKIAGHPYWGVDGLNALCYFGRTPGRSFSAHNLRVGELPM